MCTIKFAPLNRVEALHDNCQTLKPDICLCRQRKYGLLVCKTLQVEDSGAVYFKINRLEGVGLLVGRVAKLLCFEDCCKVGYFAGFTSSCGLYRRVGYGADNYNVPHQQPVYACQGISIIPSGLFPFWHIIPDCSSEAGRPADASERMVTSRRLLPDACIAILSGALLHSRSWRPRASTTQPHRQLCGAPRLTPQRDAVLANTECIVIEFETT